MSTFFKKLSIFTFMFVMIFVLTGCSEFLNFNQKPDPLITDVTTKEEAIDFLVEKAKSWNNIKIKFQVTLVALPMEGHIDYLYQKAYVVKYKTENDQKVISSYWYYTEGSIYNCEYNNNIPEYEITENVEEFGIVLNIQDYFNLIDEEKINSLDLSKFSFEKNEYQFSLGYSFTHNAKSYEIDLIYKSNTIKIVVDGIATLILEKDDPNYFNNLNIDLTLFN